MSKRTSFPVKVKPDRNSGLDTTWIRIHFVSVLLCKHLLREKGICRLYENFRSLSQYWSTVLYTCVYTHVCRITSKPLLVGILLSEILMCLKDMRRLWFGTSWTKMNISTNKYFVKQNKICGTNQATNKTNLLASQYACVTLLAMCLKHHNMMYSLDNVAYSILECVYKDWPLHVSVTAATMLRIWWQVYDCATLNN